MLCILPCLYLVCDFDFSITIQDIVSLKGFEQSLCLNGSGPIETPNGDVKLRQKCCFWPFIGLYSDHRAL